MSLWDTYARKAEREIALWDRYNPRVGREHETDCKYRQKFFAPKSTDNVRPR